MCHTRRYITEGQKEDRHARAGKRAGVAMGGRRVGHGEGYHDGKEQAEMSERFLAISQVFPVRERPCPTPYQLIYGLQDTCKHESRCRRGCSGSFLNVLMRITSPRSIPLRSTALDFASFRLARFKLEPRFDFSSPFDFYSSLYLVSSLVLS